MVSRATDEHGDSLERDLRDALAHRDTGAARPERVGRYRLERELGSGGMATVYLARDEVLDRTVAVKLIRGALLFAPEARRRFRREALAAARLDHPGICHLYEVGEMDDVPYMVMRYVPGQPLSQIITRSLAQSSDAAPAPAVLPARTWDRVVAVVHLVEKAARALHVAHVQGLVHRDVKPANLMITPDGDPVVLDFGVVHDERDAEQRRTL